MPDSSFNFYQSFPCHVQAPELEHTDKLCLIDFETLEIYSLQDWHQGYRIRDYWVEIELDDDEIQIDVYHIPE